MPEVNITASDLLDVPQGEITEAGLRSNISVTLEYLDEWIAGSGAVAINGIMEDTATAEISRSQLWQWIWTNSRLSDNRTISQAMYMEMRADELSKLAEGRDDENVGNLDKATELLDELISNPKYIDFLTIPGNRYLE
jgi:malate synthase